MVGNKLNKYIDYYLGLPYWKNQVSEDGTILAEGPFAGKGSPHEIDYINKIIAHKEKIDLNKLSKEKLHQLQTKYHVGIDCSGLVYNLLEAHSQDLGLPGIYYEISGEWRGVKRFGIRSVSALSYSQKTNSIPITDLSNTTTGDIICLTGKDGVGHVIFIVDSTNSAITCIQSSSDTFQPFVHEFTIEITKPNGHIFEQKWLETDSNNHQFLDLFDLTNKTTDIYRPNFLCP